jgi:hypothetical protein
MERMDFKSFCNAVVNGIAEYLLQYEIESIRLEKRVTVSFDLLP